YTSQFHDITTGNDTNGTSTNAFFAVPGFDLCSGWGTPAGAALINALAPLPDPLIVTPSTGFVSSGVIGGPFTVTNQTFVLTNVGASTLNWVAVNPVNWLTISATNGSLTHSVATNVVVSLNANAYNLG